MAPKLPQQFGSYTLQELIARGGMAEIYRATMPGVGGFEKTVAIKKILPHLAENDEFITMLIDEARIIVSINHANIAQVYDLGKIDEDYYIAMEYIHGIDLSTIVKDLKESGETVPVEHAVFIASSIAAGLHVAHNKCDENGRPLHIVHRDVSPHNILISFAGDVKIIDFGVAKARGKEAHTQLGVIKGKLLYMAPEQAMAKELDGRADLFAMGLILYRMLTNHLPFEGDNEFQIYNYILSKEITPPRAFNPAIPEEVNQIVMMLLQRDPSKRYQDGYSAKVDLDRALQSLAPGYSISRLSRWVEDNFSHLAEKNRENKKNRKNDSGQNDYAPPTPSRNQMTDQVNASGDGWDQFHDDDMEDTVNLSLESPEAKEMLREARHARAEHHASGSRPAPPDPMGPTARLPATQGPADRSASQRSGEFGPNPQRSGEFPSNASGQFRASGGPPQSPSNSGGFPRPPSAASGQYSSSASGQYSSSAAPAASGEFPPSNRSGELPSSPTSGPAPASNSSGQFPPSSMSGEAPSLMGLAETSGHYEVFQSGRHDAVGSGQYSAQGFAGDAPARAAPLPGQTGPVSQADARAAAGERNFPVVPAVGILLLLLAIAAMLAYQLFAGEPEPESNDPEPTPLVVGADEGEADDEASATNGAVAPAEAAEPDAGAVPDDEERETVELNVKSVPAGAKVYLGDELLGETPLLGELDQGEDVVVLRVEKEGFEPAEVRAIPFETVRKSVDLEASETTEEEATKPKPKPKRKKKRPRGAKKKVEKETKPAIPLLGFDDDQPSKDDSDDIIDPFGN